MNFSQIIPAARTIGQAWREFNAAAEVCSEAVARHKGAAGFREAQFDAARAEMRDVYLAWARFMECFAGAVNAVIPLEHFDAIVAGVAAATAPETVEEVLDSIRDRYVALSAGNCDLN